MTNAPSSFGFAERAQEPYASIPTDPDAFLLWASAQPRERGRFELSQAGTIDMQAGTTRYHNLICMNVVSELRRLLDLSVFTVAHADFAVKSGRSVRYPDVVVDRPGLIDNGLVATNPIVIAEVLSPSTTALGGADDQSP